MTDDGWRGNTHLNCRLRKTENGLRSKLFADFACHQLVQGFGDVEAVVQDFSHLVRDRHVDIVST
jgi:hypothetical protein